ncbi:MAG TPA: metallophosphoesterase [Myxococcales bacterium]|jgi:hypothetical protein
MIRKSSLALALALLAACSQPEAVGGPDGEATAVDADLAFDSGVASPTDASAAGDAAWLPRPDASTAPDVGAPPDAAQAGLDVGPGRPDAASVVVDAGATGIRDWARYPAIVQVDTSSDIWALGDVHADYDRLTALLAAAGVAPVPASPSAAQWSAGTAVLVCTGDLIDKWYQNLDVLSFMQALASSASAAGGRVVVTMGNHEAEFLADPYNTKAVDFVAELNAASISPADVASGKHPLGQYLRSLPIAARVNDWFFAHAGNTSGASLATLDANLRAGVDALGFGAPVLSDPDSILEYKLDTPAPWWEVQGGDPATTLAQDAAAVNAKHIVQGHQPGKVLFSDGTTRSKGTAYQKFGEIFLIDVGMSLGVDDSTGALLHIHRDAGSGKSSAQVVKATGATSTLWTE